MSPREAAETRLIGRVVRPHGIAGELVVDSRTDSPELRFAAGASILATRRDGGVQTVTVTAARPHAGRLLLKVAGVSDRDAAEALRGALLSAAITGLPDTGDPDEFYDHELEGLPVFTVAGQRVGTLREVLHGAGGDLLVVDRDGGEVLVPFVRQIVPEVDIVNRRIVLDPPPGLLDESAGH